MANPTIALSGLQPQFGQNFLSGQAQGQDMAIKEAAVAQARQQAEAAKRQEGLAPIVNAFRYIKAGTTPEDQGARLENVKKWALTQYPDAADKISGITVDLIEPIYASLTAPQDQLKEQKIGADIGLIGAKTQDIGADNSRADSVAGAQIANYGSMIGDRANRTALYGEGVRSGGGQKAPAGYRFTESGDLQFIPGGPADPARKGPAGGTVVQNPDGSTTIVPGPPKLNEGQSKDVGFVTRARTVGPQLDAVEADLTDMDSAMGSSVPLVGNYLQSDKYRLANQLGREFVALVLRKDSGAAVTDQEMARYTDTYLPKPGDDPTTLARKREARSTFVQGLEAGLGSAVSAVPGNGSGDSDIIEYDASGNPL